MDLTDTKAIRQSDFLVSLGEEWSGFGSTMFAAASDLCLGNRVSAVLRRASNDKWSCSSGANWHTRAFDGAFPALPRVKVMPH